MPSNQLIYAVPANLSSGAAHCVHTLKMASALRRLGLSVELLVRSAPDDNSVERAFELTDEFPITAIGRPGFGPGGLRFALAVIARSRRGDKLLTRNLPTATVASLMGRYTALELHSPVETWREQVMFRLFLERPTSIAFLTITQALKQRFIDDFGSSVERLVHVLPDAADPITPTEQASDGINRVGYVGSFHPGKGAHQVLSIAKLMPSVVFDLIGGPIGALDDIECPSNVNLIGYLPHAEAMRRLSTFNVVVLPNQPDVIVSGGRVNIGQWTSPLKLFEYMAARKPIVASRIPVLEEVLNDGWNSLLATPDSPKDWAEKIQNLLDNPKLARRISQAAHKDLIDKYSWTARANRVAGILDLEIAP